VAVLPKQVVKLEKLINKKNKARISKIGSGAETDKYSAETDKSGAELDETAVPKKSAETGGNRKNGQQTPRANGTSYNINFRQCGSNESHLSKTWSQLVWMYSSYH
jgi:hypothetical protein